jgi:hypothetical protein
LLHRDFKPDNVLVGRDGRVRVTDFGLARPIVPPTGDEQETTAYSGSLPPTAPGAIVGTLSYLAPERLFGSPANQTTDQFAFCVSMWEALFRERPFHGRTVVELAMSVTAGPPTPPLVVPEVPAMLVEMVKRGLTKNADKRWPDMEALLAALAVVAAPRVEPRAGLRPALLVAAGAIGLGLAALAYVLATREAASPSPDVAPPTPREEPVAVRPPPPVEPERERPEVGVAPAPIDRIELRAAASPRSATLLLDGAPLDGNPAVVSLPRSETVHRIEARADGYQTDATEIVAEKNHSVVLELTKPHRRKSGSKPRRDDKLTIEQKPPWAR